MTEKEVTERYVAERFLAIYNAREATSYRIIEHSDSPDFHCQDESGTDLNLEITLTEDRPGDIPALRGRSESRSAKALERHMEVVKRGEANVLGSVSCLQGNVRRMAQMRIQPKLAKDYGLHVALVVGDVSPLGWNWEDVIPDLASSLDLKNSPFEKGIWIISMSGNHIYRIV